MFSKDKSNFLIDLVEPYATLFKNKMGLFDHVDNFYNFKLGGRYTIILEGFPSDVNYNEIRVI